MGRRWRRLAVSLLGTVLAGAALLIAPGAAQAAPDCSIAHDVHPYSDSSGGAWQLELDAVCADSLQSGTFGIRWDVRFWAEPQGGGDRVAWFTRGITQFHPQQFAQRGTHNFVQISAPLGYGRYCYNAEAYFTGFPAYGGGQMVKATGTRCTDA